MSTERTRYPRADRPCGARSSRRAIHPSGPRSGDVCGALRGVAAGNAGCRLRCEGGESCHLDGLDGGTLRAQMLEPAGGRTLASAFAVALRQLRQSCRKRFPPPSPNALPHFLHLNTAAPRETPWKSQSRNSTQPTARSNIEQMSDIETTASGGARAHSSGQHQSIPQRIRSCGGVSPTRRWVAA